MGYTTDGISNATITPFEGSIALRAIVETSGKIAQCYVSGELAGYQSPCDGSVEFILPELSATDLVFLLLVDPQDAGCDYFSDAFPINSDWGNRISVALPQLTSYLPGDRWRVYLGHAGQETADEIAIDREFYLGSRRCCGFGMDFSAASGGFGFDVSDCAGLGLNFGLGEFGMDCHMLTFTSQPLPPGQYPLKVEIIDRYGNASVPTETVVSLRTCPRPARELAITAFDQSTDTLELSWTPSEDI